MIPIDATEYLRDHLGCKWSIAVEAKHLRKWSKGSVLQEENLKDLQINCCQELPNEITLESDYTCEEIGKNKENQEHAEKILQEQGAGYYISSHKGKSDYIRFRFTTKQEITPQLRLAIIRYLAKPELKFDEAFFSLNYVRPVPNRYHWKHSYEIEKVIKIVEGQDLDIDKLGIKAPLKPQKIKVYSGSLPNIKLQEPRGWALSISISRMAQRYNLTNCPKCNNTFSFKDSHGLFYCKACKYGGGLKKFSQLILLLTEKREHSIAPVNISQEATA
jgi:hypothetical protein